MGIFFFCDKFQSDIKCSFTLVTLKKVRNQLFILCQPVCWYTQEEENIVIDDQVNKEDGKVPNVGDGDESSLASDDENPHGEEGNESDTTFYSVTSRYQSHRAYYGFRLTNRDD